MNMAFQNFVRKTRLAQSIINYCVIVYMDDILVYSSSYEGHVQHIEWALHALRDAGFKVALEKLDHVLGGTQGRGYPTIRQEYLKPYEIIPHAFYPRADEVVIDDDEEEDDDDEETSEEGSYSEHSEGELSEGEEEEEETGSEWEALPEEATRTGTEVEDPKAARKREEIATRKRQLEFASEVSLHVGSDPTRDPEPSKHKDGDPAAATSSTTRRRRSRSPSSSSPTHPPVCPRTDAGDRHSSSDAVPPTP
ncbi:hypothetical protein CBR_g49082 [Chara braunii]|uniref:Reverse transcriptase domain-containing protein n=1 Tax=Chara braunii TaxID=69332 RepID=A0A388M4H0_CHABU|nr:hypothetical protein CBR_g49082 [Chara braunii]|eukprot:GBG89372.1 hypothetical protein CBR_g49082 [Chara braunii]